MESCALVIPRRRDRRAKEANILVTEAIARGGGLLVREKGIRDVYFDDMKDGKNQGYI